MIVGVHQPNYLPYPGFFTKMAAADVLVLYDTAQFSKNDFHNRNRIKTPRGPHWLTVPIRRAGIRPIRDIKIVDSAPWAERHMRSMEANYRRAPYYESYASELRSVLTKGWEGLVDLNVALITLIGGWLGLSTRLVRSSELGEPPTDNPSAKLVHFTRTLGGTTYLSGSNGRAYLDETQFTSIGLEYVEHVPRPYPQLFGEFLPNLSIVDAIFNCGESARHYI